MPEKEFIPEMIRLSAMPFAESLSLLLYGGSGSSKTFFSGTAGPRNVILNAGDGLTTLQSPAFREKYPFNPWVINIPKEGDRVDYVCNSIDYLLRRRMDDFDIVTIDDASAFSRYAMEKAVDINADMQKSTTKAMSVRHGGIISPSVQDYGEEIKVIEWFLAEYTAILKEANKHFILTAHERHIYGKAPAIGDARPLKRILPGFTGQTFPDKIPAYFDEVWRAEVVGSGDKKKWRFHTQGNELQVGKSRHGGVFKEKEENITFPYVIQQIKQHKYIPDPNNPELLIAVKG